MSWYKFSKHQIKGVHEISLQIFDIIKSLDSYEMDWYYDNEELETNIIYFTEGYNIDGVYRPVVLEFFSVSEHTASFQAFTNKYKLEFPRVFLDKSRRYIKIDIIAHEVSHMLEYQNYRKSFENKNSSLPENNEWEDGEYITYVNQPTEIKSAIQQIYYEISTNIHNRKNEQFSYMLDKSSKFNSIYKYLTVQNRKILMQGLYYKFREESIDNSKIINHNLEVEENRIQYLRSRGKLD